MKLSALVTSFFLATLAGAGTSNSVDLPPNALRTFLQNIPESSLAGASISSDSFLRNAEQRVAPEVNDIVFGEDRSITPPQASVVDEPQQATSQVVAADPNARLSVIIPPSLPVLTSQARAEELMLIFHHIRLRFRSYLPDREVLPLLVENLDSVTYRRVFLRALNGLLSKTDRFLWTQSPTGKTYMFSRPMKTDPEFVSLHGRPGRKNENLYTVWRLDTFGPARVWRYLGAMEMANWRTMEAFKRNFWDLIEPPYSNPHFYFNDASHLDPSQTPANLMPWQMIRHQSHPTLGQ